MKVNVAKNRLESVINVDSINSSEFDFMATHIPFRKIALKFGHSGIFREYLSEDELLNKFFSDLNTHKFVIVDGANGTGKSHFIRWVYTKLLANYNIKKNSEILLIRRGDNTLKGTIHQLLMIDAIKDLKNRDNYEKLVKANSTISEKKFKDTIYYQFIVELENSSECVLPSLQRKRLIALLNNADFKQQLMKDNGAISKIYSKISPSVFNQDVIAQFNKEDFIVSFDLYDTMKQKADREAIKIARQLIDDENQDEELLNDICSEMNGLVESVIQTSAGIQAGDFEQIFKEIRQELYKKNKTLILLIEDITSFTGVNKALLNVLQTEHTGEYEKDKMCPLISIVGTTTEYYKSFRDNYKDRITDQITIEDGTIGDNENDLYLFFAKYLNAISVSKDEVEEWYYKNNASDSELPVHNPDVEDWEYINYYDKRMSLYPFTKRAIINLYNCMNENKTPRYILKFIIDPAVIGIIEDKKTFLKCYNNFDNPVSDNMKLVTTVKNLSISKEKEKDYLAESMALIGFWGNSNLQKVGGEIAGIPKKIYFEFGLDELYKALVGNTDEVINDSINNVEPITTSQTKEKNIYVEFNKNLVILNQWHNEKQPYSKAINLVNDLNNVLIGLINWQQLGISKQTISMVVEQAIKLFTFEGQDKSEEKGLIKLPNDDETYFLLRAILSWHYKGKKTWDYDNSSDDIYIITSWIEKNKSKILKSINLNLETPQYIKMAMVCEIFRNILLGNKIDKDTKLTPKIFLHKYDNKIKSKHSNSWINFSNLCNSPGKGDVVYNVIIDYFNISLSSSNDRKFIDYHSLEKAFEEIKINNYAIKLNENEEINNCKKVKDISEFYLKLIDNFNKIIKDEKDYGRLAIESIFNVFGFNSKNDIVTKDDILEFIDEIDDFYMNCERNNILYENPMNNSTVKNEAQEICVVIKELLKIYSENNSIDQMFNIARYDIGKVVVFNEELIKLKVNFEKIKQNIDTRLESMKNNATTSDLDIRFEKKEEIKNKCLEEVKHLL